MGSERIDTAVLVLGGGPGGTAAAEQCARLGLSTILVERSRLGGTCLQRGCIPSKALIHAAEAFGAMTEAAHTPRFGVSLPAPPQLDLAETMRWKDGVVSRLTDGLGGALHAAGVRLIEGEARFIDARTCRVRTADGELTIQAGTVVLAAGSVPASLPSLPFGGAVMSSTELLSVQTLPDRLVVVGAGYIGLEMGGAFRRLGAAVTVVEAQTRILPNWDERLTAPVRRRLQRDGVAIHLGARVQGFENGIVSATAADGTMLSLQADAVLVTVGRLPNTEGWGLEEMGLERDGRFVRVDDRCATATRNVWAIGDLVGEPMLAHKAAAQGRMVAELIAGKRRRFDPRCIPAVCYTTPEIVSVGIGPDAAVPADTIISILPFTANGRALTLGNDDGGFVRVIARKADGLVLGIQAVGTGVAELSGEFAHALEMGAVLDDIAGTIHAHPTLGEAFHDAALRGLHLATA